MTKEAKNMLREAIIPVLLGDCARAHLLALRIYFDCGVVSYVCDTGKSLFSLIDPASRFFPLFSSQSSDVVLDSLAYAAKEAEYLPVLVPCSDKYAELVKENREFLESRFIISDSSSLFSCPPLSELL